MTSEFSQFPSFPKNLSYNLRKMSSSLIKSKIRVAADQTEYKANSIIRINFPIGRMFDFRSAILYSTNATCTGTGGVHFPRGGLNSLIQNLSITANSRPLQTTNDYNLVWNILADAEGYYSLEQSTKRITELWDPSVVYTFPNGSSLPAPVFNANNTTNDGAGANDNKAYCVNNFLGFFSGSCSCLNTNDIGQLQLSISLAPSSCLWYKTDATAPTDANYSLKDVFFTVDTITFNSSIYYELVKNQLEGDGLNVAYYDYIVQQFPSTAKSTGGINISTQINSSSLDMVIATYRNKTYDTIGELLLSTQVATTNKTFNEVALLPITTSAGVGTSQLGTAGAFNNSVYFRRNGGGYDSSQFSVNSQLFTVSSSPIECFNNALISLGYQNLDIQGGGMHPGCLSLGFYCHSYFADILSLENISGDSNWWVSGLSGGGGTTLINHVGKFASGVTDEVIPVLIMRVSKVLNIKMGRLLDVME